MEPKNFFNRIEINPQIRGGKPVFKNTRIPVYIILNMLRDGLSFDEIIREYPRISEDDIRAGLDYSIYLLNFTDDEVISLV